MHAGCHLVVSKQVSVPLRKAMVPHSEPVPRRAKVPTAGASPIRHIRGRLEWDGTKLHWTILRIPEEIPASWEEKRRLRVRGTVNGVTFRSSLFADSHRPGGLILLVNKQVQRAVGVQVGDLVDVLLQPDLEDRPAALPGELLLAFQGDKTLRRWTEALSESMRREISKWILGVGAPEARARRADQMAERLLGAMEGERRLPPVLEALFAHSPKARAAWDGLTPVQRRAHLLGVFYYRTPEARTRRAQRAVDEALRVAEKRQRSGK